ncbi:MAG: metallophosphoesterase [Flavobacteriales bacterium]|nr:metallophosphoesterase [Flavobacteriales bacterium]
MKKNLLLFGFLLVGMFALQAQTVVRGPYLQSVTHQSIKVMWRTSTACPSKVWYGTDPNALDQSVVVSGNRTNHIVFINGLNPSTRYYYSVGFDNTTLAGASVNHYFTTHPVPGSPVPVRVWAIGDFGRGNAGQVAVKTSYENYTGTRGTDVWLWLGDNAYQDGTDAEYQNHVFAVPGFSDIFSNTPFWPSPGNHDYNTVWSESTLLGIPYTNIPFSAHEGPYFDMVEVPRYAEAGGFPSQHEVFYSFDYGDVHFLSLNSEVFDYTLSYSGINQMKTWIEQDLQQNTRKFTIAYFHQPPYSKGSHDSDAAFELVMKAMREKVIPLLESFDIDIVVCGHSHVFERSYLIKGHYGNSSEYNAATMLMNGTMGNFQQGESYVKDSTNATPEGTVYVVCGNSGSSESGPALNHPVMAYTHGGSGEMGSFVMDIYRNRLDGRYLKSTGEIADEFTILKKDVRLSAIALQTVCLGDSAVLTANYTGGSDSVTFVWNPGGYTSQSITVSPVTNSVYTVTVTDWLTGQVETRAATVQVLEESNITISEPVPGTLSIPSPGNGFSYQWYLNGSPVQGANGLQFTPFFNGNYTLLITSVNGCSYETPPYTFINVANVVENETAELSVFPNPSSGILHIKISGPLTGKPFAIHDAAGKVVYNGVLQQMYTQIQLQEFENGTYFLRIQDAETDKSYPLILMK